MSTNNKLYTNVTIIKVSKFLFKIDSVFNLISYVPSSKLFLAFQMQKFLQNHFQRKVLNVYAFDLSLKVSIHTSNK